MMCRFYLVFSAVICLISIFGFSVNIIPEDSFNNDDKTRFLSMFNATLNNERADSNNYFYGLLGYYQLAEKLPEKSIINTACDKFKKSLNAQSAFILEEIYSALEGINILQENCLLTNINVGDLKEKLLVELNSSKQFNKIFYSLSSLIRLKEKVDLDKIDSILAGLFKADSSAVSMSFIFQSAVLAKLPKTKLKVYFDEIEDVIMQADELNGKILYLENGLFSTAFLVDAIYKLSEAYGQIPNIPEEKLVKLSNYFVSRKFIYQPKAAAYLLSAVKTLSRNKRLVPIAARFVNTNQLVRNEKGFSGPAQISITNLWNEPIHAKFSVLSLAAQGGKTRPINKAAVNLVYDRDQQVYNLDLSDLDLQPDFYLLSLGVDSSATATDGSRLIGVSSTNPDLRPQLAFKVLDGQLRIGPLTVHHAELLDVVSGGGGGGSGGHAEDSPGSTSAGGEATPASLGGGGVRQEFVLLQEQRLSSKIVVDSDSKLVIWLATVRLVGAEARQEFFRPRQVFLRLSHELTGHEVFLIAEPSAPRPVDAASNVSLPSMVVTVNPHQQIADFDHQSGDYSMEMIVGDALLARSLVWPLGVASVQVPARPPSPPTAPSASVHAGDAPSLTPLASKPSIEHQFRTPDRRASSVLASTFSVLCVAPIVVLLYLWFRIGVNVSGVSGCLFSSTMFHLFLSGIFVVYYLYWTRFNMFLTLGLLACLGVPTFLFGNTMLRAVAVMRIERKSRDS